MPLMLSEVAAGRLTLEHYVRLSAEAPARAFGLWPWKGRVEAGAHADIAVVDLARTEVIAAGRLHSRGRITPFEGKPTTGAPVHTLVRGCFVQRDRALVREARGWGRQVGVIQSMPKPTPRHREQTLASAVHGPAVTFAGEGQA